MGGSYLDFSELKIRSDIGEGVLGDDNKTVIFGEVPDAEIVNLIELNEFDLCRTRISRLQLLQQPE